MMVVLFGLRGRRLGHLVSCFWTMGLLVGSAARGIMAYRWGWSFRQDRAGPRCVTFSGTTFPRVDIRLLAGRSLLDHLRAA